MLPGSGVEPTEPTPGAAFAAPEPLRGVIWESSISLEQAIEHASAPAMPNPILDREALTPGAYTLYRVSAGHAEGNSGGSAGSGRRPIPARRCRCCRIFRLVVESDSTAKTEAAAPSTCAGGRRAAPGQTPTLAGVWPSTWKLARGGTSARRHDDVLDGLPIGELALAVSTVN